MKKEGKKEKIGKSLFKWLKRWFQKEKLTWEWNGKTLLNNSKMTLGTLT